MLTEGVMQSDFYTVMLPYINGKAPPGAITLQDADLHRQIKKPVTHIFSTSNMVSYESFVDSTMAFFFGRLDELYTRSDLRFRGLAGMVRL